MVYVLCGFFCQTSFWCAEYTSFQCWAVAFLLVRFGHCALYRTHISASTACIRLKHCLHDRIMYECTVNKSTLAATRIMSVGRFVDHKLETRYKLNSKHKQIIRFMGSFETRNTLCLAMCTRFVTGCNAFKFTLNSIHLMCSILRHQHRCVQQSNQFSGNCIRI